MNIISHIMKCFRTKPARTKPHDSQQSSEQMQTKHHLTTEEVPILKFEESKNCVLKRFDNNRTATQIPADCAKFLNVVLAPQMGAKRDICTLSSFEGENLGEVLLKLFPTRDGKQSSWNILDRRSGQMYFLQREEDSSVKSENHSFVLYSGTESSGQEVWNLSTKAGSNEACIWRSGRRKPIASLGSSTRKPWKKIYVDGNVPMKIRAEVDALLAVLLFSAIPYL